MVHTTMPARFAAHLLGAALCLFLLAGVSLAEGLTVLSPTLYPLHYSGDSRVAEGYSFDLLDSLMRSQGLEYDRGSVRFSTLARVLADATKATGGMAVGLTRTPDRERSFQWVGPIVHLKLGLVARKDRRLSLDGADPAKRLKIAVVRGSEGENLLGECFKLQPFDSLPVNSFANQFRMLDYDRVDAVVHADLTAPRTLLNLGLDPEDYEMIYVLREIDLYYAFGLKVDSSLVQALQAELDRLGAQANQLLEFLLARHMGGQFLPVAQGADGCAAQP